MGGVAASGGYYIALGADKIIANPGTTTGSIGVIMSYPVIKELMHKFGIGNETIKSGKLKDAGSIYRYLKDEERKYFQELVDDLHEQFVKVVSIERGISMDKAHSLANGRVYSGRQALKYGLIDILGTMEDAIHLLGDEVKKDGKPTIVYPPEKKKGLIDMIIGDIFQGETIDKLKSNLYPEYKIRYIND